MNILALESSAVTASVALCRDETLVAEQYLDTGLTHSETLLPLAVSLMERCGLGWQDVDVLAVAQGPGSFTGLRIGVSAVKGLAWGAETPCFGCSTLASMGWNLWGETREICCVMDARRNEVYNARFRWAGDHLQRLCPDRAISVADLTRELLERPEEARVLLGDGAELCARLMADAPLKLEVAPPHLRRQRAWGVAQEARYRMAQGERALPPAALNPIYLRLSQAERERLARAAQVQGIP